MKVLLSLSLLFITLLFGNVSADTYLHNPRGSNDRLNEKSANRQNGNRLFDSQNNNRGGYNVGDKSATAFTSTGTLSQQMDRTAITNTVQYPMVYLENSELSMEWTNQHGCGGDDQSDPHKTNCNIVIQYMCENPTETDRAMKLSLRDGTTTDTPTAPKCQQTGKVTSFASAITTAENANNQPGHHESEAYYCECQLRNRNKGLFTADQNLKGDAAIYTRQNPNGNRNGLECPEERDYYPYWAPTPWVDVAYLTDDIPKCNELTAFSQNTMDKCKCVDSTNYNSDAPLITDQATCTAKSYSWKCWNWNTLKMNPGKPECLPAPWTRENQNGNARGDATAQTTNAGRYTFKIPDFSVLSPSTASQANPTPVKCVLRLRYNISTDDYDPWHTDSKSSADRKTGRQSIITNNPTVNVGATQTLKLAINTAQYGRTFQDRTHTFYVKKRVTALNTILGSSTDNKQRIVNLNVRGKRGNIVQTYPAVEYDFIPNNMTIGTTDAIHIQWTGSNTHNNGGPGGDGQTGDAGEGTGGTDRSNFVLALDADDNYPMALDKTTDNFFSNVNCYDYEGNSITQSDCQIILATAGYFTSYTDAASTNRAALDPLLNNAPASLAQGIILKPKSTAAKRSYYYLCTRNNNFSNRSQKGQIDIA